MSSCVCPSAARRQALDIRCECLHTGCAWTHARTHTRTHTHMQVTSRQMPFHNWSVIAKHCTGRPPPPPRHGSPKAPASLPTDPLVHILPPRTGIGGGGWSGDTQWSAMAEGIMGTTFGSQWTSHMKTPPPLLCGLTQAWSGLGFRLGRKSSFQAGPLTFSTRSRCLFPMIVPLGNTGGVPA